jgi:hypothetical protein
MGPGAAFDIQGYKPTNTNTFLGAIGGSFLFRLGFHA